jgi:hypothetical protein
MHAYLIVGKEREVILEKVREIADNAGANLVFFELQKIAQVRDLTKFTRLSFPTLTAIVIESIDLASEESQNAFLKNLEEPQAKVIFILTATAADSPLATITSRCHVIETAFSSNISKDQEKTFREFLEASLATKLSITSQISSRDEALLFLNTLIQAGNKELPENPELANFLEKATKALSAIKANGNVQLQLTNYVISI